MKHQVVIVGAGPAGLAFARALSGTDLDVLIVERLGHAELADPAIDGRDIALTHLSIKILKELGAWSRIPPESVSAVKEARVIDGTSPYFLHFDHRKVCDDALGYIVSNHLIRKALFDEVQTLPNVELLTDTAAVSVATDREKALVQLSNGETVEASLVVAADSRFSETRRKAGISSAIRDFGQVVIDIYEDMTGIRLRLPKDE